MRRYSSNFQACRELKQPVSYFPTRESSPSCSAGLEASPPPTNSSPLFRLAPVIWFLLAVRRSKNFKVEVLWPLAFPCAWFFCAKTIISSVTEVPRYHAWNSFASSNFQEKDFDYLASWQRILWDSCFCTCNSFDTWNSEVRNCETCIIKMQIKWEPLSPMKFECKNYTAII